MLYYDSGILYTFERLNSVYSSYYFLFWFFFDYSLHTRLMLLHDSRNDDGIKSFFQEVHELYIKVSLTCFLGIIIIIIAILEGVMLDLLWYIT